MDVHSLHQFRPILGGLNAWSTNSLLLTVTDCNDGLTCHATFHQVDCMSAVMWFSAQACCFVCQHALVTLPLSQTGKLSLQTSSSAVCVSVLVCNPLCIMLLLKDNQCSMQVFLACKTEQLHPSCTLDLLKKMLPRTLRSRRHPQVPTWHPQVLMGHLQAVVGLVKRSQPL